MSDKNCNQAKAKQKISRSAHREQRTENSDEALNCTKPDSLDQACWLCWGAHQEIHPSKGREILEGAAQ